MLHSTILDDVGPICWPLRFKQAFKIKVFVTPPPNTKILEDYRIKCGNHIQCGMILHAVPQIHKQTFLLIFFALN